MNLKKLTLFNLGLSPLVACTSLETSPKSLNIAISSTFGSRTHVKYLFEIAQYLRNRGHNVIYVTPQGNFKYSKPYNYTEYDIGGIIQNSSDLMKTVDIDLMIKDSMKIMSKHFSDIITYYYELNF